MLSACFDVDNPFNGSTSGSLASSVAISGQYPVTDATITINTADGDLLATTINDTSTYYQVTVPNQASYPYTITATSGTELVSGSTPEYPLYSVITGPDVEVANINAFTTLIVLTAQYLPGGLTSENIAQAEQIILEQLNYGLDVTLLPDPITTPITNQNAASLLKANEVLSEMIRRTHKTLQIVGYDISEGDIISDMAADIADGYLDGNSGSDGGELIAAIANIMSGQVLIEGLGNNLNVNGSWATDYLDNAISTALQSTGATSAEVTITAAMLQQTKIAIKTAQAINPSESLSTLALIINSLNPGANPADIETLIPQDRAQDFADAIILAASASKEQLASINESVHPAVNKSADDSTLSLAWYSNPGQILGYIVYFGPTPTTATTIASETSGTSVQYLTKSVLGLNVGDNVCFRLKAFNLAGLSGYSGAACMQI